MKNYKSIFLAVFLAFVYTINFGQTVKLKISNEETNMTVSGTSTLHDWTSEVKTVNGHVEIGSKMLKKSKVKSGDLLPSVHIIVPVKSIISPRGATMDKKTYNALKAEDNPEITFDIKNCKVTSSTDTSFKLNASGNLTIAGVTKNVEFPVEGKFISNEKLSFNGAYKLNMVEYDMEPPSAMFGQIETGDEVEIKFELIVLK